MFQGIEPAVDRRPGAAVDVGAHKLVDLAKGDLGEGDSHLRKEQAQITRITRDAMARRTVCGAPSTAETDRGRSGVDVIQALPLANPRLHPRHRLVVLRAFGAVIQLRITERDVEGAVAHQLFDHFQGAPA